ncbi:acyl carrier protein [Colwelliaceae bacterium 6441]
MENDQIKQTLVSILSNLMPSYDQAYWQDNAELIGAVPEFDSMTIVNLIGELEEQLGVELNDDEVTEEHFATVGAVTDLVIRTLS